MNLAFVGITLRCSLPPNNTAPKIISIDFRVGPRYNAHSGNLFLPRHSKYARLISHVYT